MELYHSSDMCSKLLVLLELVRLEVATSENTFVTVQSIVSLPRRTKQIETMGSLTSQT